MSIEPCPTSPGAPSRGIVEFDPAAFKTLYPAFATVSDAALNRNFILAELFLNNSCYSVVKNAAKREVLLNLLVAHITALFDGANGATPGGLVGRVNDVTEGSVKVGAEFPTNPNQAWFVQTQWGAMFWAATAPYRTMRYVVPPAVCADFPGGGVWPVVGPGGCSGGC